MAELIVENKKLVEANNIMRTKIKELEMKAVQSPKGLSLKDFKAWNISGGENGEISKLLRNPRNQAWLKAIDTKLQSAEQAVKK